MRYFIPLLFLSVLSTPIPAAESPSWRACFLKEIVNQMEAQEREVVALPMSKISQRPLSNWYFFEMELAEGGVYRGWALMFFARQEVRGNLGYRCWLPRERFNAQEWVVRMTSDVDPGDGVVVGGTFRPNPLSKEELRALDRLKDPSYDSMSGIPRQKLDPSRVPFPY